MRAGKWIVILVGSLVAGCASPLGPSANQQGATPLPPKATMVLSPTSAPTIAKALPPTSTVVLTVTHPLPTAIPTKATGGITLTITYDNNQHDERLKAAWGFSCLVEGLEETILFDTGGNSTILLRNMRTLGIDPLGVDAVVISHIHGDHVGGLAGFLEENHAVTVYLPQSFPESIKDTTRGTGAELVEVHQPVQICERVYSTGELGDLIKEQSLVIETSRGLIVITGCAHPGVVNVVREAKDLLDDDVHLVLGGFHLCWMNLLQVNSIVEGVKDEGVEQVAPCHCSGDLARSTFERVYGDDFILAGIGRRLEIRD